MLHLSVEQPIKDRRFVRQKARLVFDLHQLPVVLAILDFLDCQVAADRQVDDGRGHVLGIGALVEDQAQLCRPQVVGRLVLGHERFRAEERSYALGRILRQVVRGGVLHVAASPPDHAAHPGGAEQEQEHRPRHGRRPQAEKFKERPRPGFQDRDDGARDALLHAHDDRQLLARWEDAGGAERRLARGR